MEINLTKAPFKKIKLFNPGKSMGLLTLEKSPLCGHQLPHL